MAKPAAKPDPITYAEMENELFDAAYSARIRGEKRKAEIYEGLTRALRYIQRGEFHVFKRGLMRDNIDVTDAAPYGAPGDLELPGKK